MNTIGSRLKALRKKYNYTGEEVGNMLKVSKVAIYNWEKDMRSPNPDVIEKLANIYEVSTDYLITGKESTSTKDGYYRDPEAAEYAEYLRTRPEAKLLFSASRDMSKEDMEEVVNYIEYLKSKHK